MTGFRRFVVLLLVVSLALPGTTLAQRSGVRDADALVAQARAQMKVGKTEQAIETALRATAAAPDSAEAHYWLGNAYGNRIGELSMFGKMRMAPKLRDAFERAVALDSGHLKARSALVEYYLLAPAAIGGGVDKARAQAMEIGKRDKARGSLALARIAIHEDKRAEALKRYQAAIAASPGDPDVQFEVAMAYVRAERFDDAVPLLRKVVAQKPDIGMAWYQIGRSAALSGQFLDEGAKALLRYMKMPHERGDPDTKHVLYRLGQVQAQAGQRERALANWNRALKLDPEFSEAREAIAGAASP